MEALFEAISVFGEAVGVGREAEDGHETRAGTEVEILTAISIIGIGTGEMKDFLCPITTSAMIEAGIEIDGTETLVTTATASEAEDPLLHKEEVARLIILIVMGHETVGMDH